MVDELYTCMNLDKQELFATINDEIHQSQHNQSLHISYIAQDTSMLYYGICKNF